MVAQTHSHDDGFSLTELIIVLSLLGVVLAMSFGGIQVVYKSREVSDRQAQYAAEVSSPLNAFEEVISQALTVESAGQYNMTVLTDANNDNYRERHVIACTTDGLVTHQRWATSDTLTNTELEYDALWSEHNVNRAKATPMFQYWDKDYNPTTDASKARVVKITLVVEYDGREFQDSRTVLMRNR